MLIYLDLNVILDFKKEAGADLLSLIEVDKKRNIYCFSEAHLHDLSRDQTDEKYKDMELIARVAENHCFSFNQGVKFQYETPREYFDRFEWNSSLFLVEDASPEMNLVLEAFKLIPLNFAQALGNTTLPDEMPEELKVMLTETTNFYEFFNLFYGFTKELNDRQKKFKELLRFLHKHNYVSNPLHPLGIEGYDGTKITDQEKFLSSYSSFCLKSMPNASTYDGFVRMYYCLEYLGIVNGKVNKQKMLNLSNDGRHAFFGGYCDIVVSKDEDFLTKAKFMYEATGIFPYLMPAQEFYDWLKAGPRPNDNLEGMLGEILKISELYCIDQHETETTKYTSYELSKIYFEHFDVLTIGQVSDDEYFFYFQAEKRRFKKGTLILQIKILTELLLAELGPDIQNKGGYYDEEMTADGWPGRAWFYGAYQVELLLNDGLHLTFNAIPNLNN